LDSRQRGQLEDRGQRVARDRCSDCDAVKTKLRLSERTFRCDQCGHVLDRDLNAARNLAALVGEVTGGPSSQRRGGP
jgi:putative transposase